MSALAELKNPWADEETVSELKKLWADGYSASQIAAKLNKRSLVEITRSAVIGKIYRLGLKGGVRVTKVRTRTSRSYAVSSAASKKAARTKQRMQEAHAKLFVETYIAPPEPPENAPETATSFADLRKDQCRYAYGENDFRFCPERKLDPYSYCAGHAKKVYQPLPPPKKKVTA